MSYKKFSKELYDGNDNISKQAAAIFFVQKGWQVISSDEVYTYDLKIGKNGTILKIEVERKRVWKGCEFPYPTIDVPYRKRRNEADLFLMFNENFTSLLLMPMSCVKDSPTSLKNTKYTTGERFFNVSPLKAKYFKKIGDVWVEL